MDKKEKKILIAGGIIGAILLGAYLATRTKAVSSPPPPTTTVYTSTPSTIYTTTPTTVYTTTPSTSTPSTTTPSTPPPVTTYLADFLITTWLTQQQASSIAYNLQYNVPIPGAIQGFVIWNGSFRGHVTVVFQNQEAFNQLYGWVIHTIQDVVGSEFWDIDYQGPGSCQTMVQQLAPSKYSTILATYGSCVGVNFSNSPNNNPPSYQVTFVNNTQYTVTISCDTQGFLHTLSPGQSYGPVIVFQCNFKVCYQGLGYCTTMNVNSNGTYYVPSPPLYPVTFINNSQYEVEIYNTYTGQETFLQPGESRTLQLLPGTYWVFYLPSLVKQNVTINGPATITLNRPS